MGASLSLLVNFLVLLSVIWCGGCAPPVGKPMSPAVTPAASLAIDPVCGAELDISRAKGAGLTSEWKGNTYYFCSSDCKSRFDRMPMMYHAKCPVCNTTVQKTAALAGEHGGKPYFFDSREHRAAFLKEPMKYLGGLALDVVCGMEVVTAKAAEAGLTAEHQGQTYYFCGPGCKEKFVKDPPQFLGEKTAICPVCGMTVVKKDAEADRLTSVYQGNTYYFCASDCKRYFERNPEKYLKQRQ